MAGLLVFVGPTVASLVTNPILKTLIILAGVGPMAYFMLMGTIHMAATRGFVNGGTLGLGVGFLCLVLVGLPVLLPVRQLMVVADDAVGTRRVDGRKTYRGVIVDAKNSGNLGRGTACEFETRVENRLFGDAVQLRLSCGQQGLYGQSDDLGWMAERTVEGGEVLHALDQWDNEGDPGIEFRKDKGSVSYWDKSGMKLTIALERSPAAKASSPVGAPLPEAGAPSGSAATAGSQPKETASAPQVAETCAAGTVCFGQRIDVTF